MITAIQIHCVIQRAPIKASRESVQTMLDIDTLLNDRITELQKQVNELRLEVRRERQVRAHAFNIHR